MITLGNVIQTGIDIKGKINKNFLNFLIVGFMLFVDVDKMFNNESIPPTIGNIPYGSGALRSLNHKNPSVIILGLMS